MSTKHAKPTPVVVTEVCSMCGLDWRCHGDKPTTEDCIRLLKAELSRRSTTVPMPYPVQPWPRPFRPYWADVRGTWGGDFTLTADTTQHTPDLPVITCRAVSPS